MYLGYGLFKILNVLEHLIVDNQIKILIFKIQVPMDNVSDNIVVTSPMLGR